MNNRENFLSVLNFEKPEKFPITEFMGFWPEVKQAWSDKNFISDDEIFDHFDLMKIQYLPIDFNFIPPFEEKIIEESQNHIVMIDEVGCTKKVEKNSSSMPHYLDFPIKNREDFEKIKERLEPLNYPSRCPVNWKTLLDTYKNRSFPLGFIIRGPFAFCRDFVNFQDLMIMVYDDPRLMKDMMNFQTDFIIGLLAETLRDVNFDFLYLGEDMAYKNGPMFSPSLLKEIIKPLYARISHFLTDNGVEHFILDSDGDIRSLIPMFIDAGITAILPMEAAAGVDIMRIRDEYPKLNMIGGVDKLEISKGENKIDEQMKKVEYVIQRGGYIPSFDHSVPPIVSYDNYSLYLEKLRKIFDQ